VNMKTTELIHLLKENASAIQAEWADFCTGPSLIMKAHVGRAEDTHSFFILTAGAFETKFTDIFPQTLKLLRRIPRLRGASFLTALPHAVVGLHKGQYGVQRTLLGVEIPEDNSFELEGRAIPYQENQCISFHDYQEHRGWNHSSSPRTVLLVDCWSPALILPNPIRAITARVVDKTRLKNGDAQQALRLQKHLESQS